MDLNRVFKMSFAGVYPHYVAKAERKGRTQLEVEEVICWLTGYSAKALAKQIATKKDMETFFAEAPAFHPNASMITGVICGVRIEEIEHPLMQKIRYMDKLVDELAKGRPMEKILRGASGADRTAPAASAAASPRRAKRPSAVAKRAMVPASRKPATKPARAKKRTR